MTRSFRHKGLKRLYAEENGRGVASEYVEKLRDILARLDAATEVAVAVTVRTNWRVIFRFENDEALDVDYLDYH